MLDERNGGFLSPVVGTFAMASTAQRARNVVRVAGQGLDLPRSARGRWRQGAQAAVVEPEPGGWFQKLAAELDRGDVPAAEVGAERCRAVEGDVGGMREHDRVVVADEDGGGSVLVDPDYLARLVARDVQAAVRTEPEAVGQGAGQLDIGLGLAGRAVGADWDTCD